MSNRTPETDWVAEESAELAVIMERPLLGRLAAYLSRCGPGWLQGAVTLGGGSLSGSLYLGVIMGYDMLWLQPLAMMLGVVMLSAIAYVTLSTQQRPMRAISEHVSPVLAWAWLIATLMANIVWCMPQFALGTAAIQQNLLPAYRGDDIAKLVICVALLLVATVVIWFYDQGGRGLRVFEAVLKLMVAAVVVSFFGVVLKMGAGGGLPWEEIGGGLIPDLSLLFNPAPRFATAIEETGTFREFWHNKITQLQRDKIIAAFATAVGINMTFLLPYSMLKKGWGKYHRGLAVFDLSIGLIIPFVLAISCVVIASASQFHGQFADILDADGNVVAQGKALTGYQNLVDQRLAAEHESYHTLRETERASLREQLSFEEKKVAAMLVDRDAFQLARSLQPLTGEFYAHKLFGMGVLGMALSTIIVLMLISGFTFCEMFNVEPTGWPHRLGCMVAGLGVLGPFIWGGRAEFALAIPTSVFGGTLLPIAYFTFLLLMNSHSLLGDQMPRGGKRVLMNLVMVVATGVAAFTSVWGLWGRTMQLGGASQPIGKWAVAALFGLALLGSLSFFSKNSQHSRKHVD